jgi:hypothetical protein|tara:strand:+ start:4474 stop:4677 length:204 start_codon:yes stop_codon:yes gene_type:complete
MVLYGWSTKKVSNGFQWRVTKSTERKKPNAMGHYLDTKMVKSGVTTSRAKAALRGKKWKMYLQKGGK